MSETTCIYLIRDIPTGWHKIGRSYNPVVRERTLAAVTPGIELICYWTESPESNEKILHDAFVEYRRRGEWFELPELALTQIYLFMDEYQRVDVIRPARAFWVNLMQWSFRVNAVQVPANRKRSPSHFWHKRCEWDAEREDVGDRYKYYGNI